MGVKGEALGGEMDFKKVFFSEWCIKLEENNRRGKSRDLFRKLEVSREHIAQRRTQ